ncbi:MAG: FHA domain-containing protein [Myxococcaceae bacterium]
MLEATQTQAIFAKPALLLDGVRHELPTGLFRIGRDPQNHLVLEDSGLSRTHFVIDVYAHQAQLIDVGSANGTYVNKKRVHSTWLKDGDRIRVGDHILVFQAPAFVMTPAALDEAEQTHTLDAAKNFHFSWLPLLALLVASASLFMQLVNRERQMGQDLVLKRMWAELAKPVVEVASNGILEPEKPEKKWQKALLDFKSGSEDEACENIKALIPELHPQDLLKAKAKSFFERKCVL